jgi:hypothetical protein
MKVHEDKKQRSNKTRKNDLKPPKISTGQNKRQYSEIFGAQNAVRARSGGKSYSIKVCNSLFTVSARWTPVCAGALGTSVTFVLFYLS